MLNKSNMGHRGGHRLADRKDESRDIHKAFVYLYLCVMNKSCLICDRQLISPY